MELAIRLAERAGQKGEVPIGAVLVARTGEILAQAGNRTVRDADPTAHAEILALRAGAKTIGNFRLLDTTLYVTIEPCLMCMGALVHARVRRLVFGAPDPKWGAAGSLYDFSTDQRLNHRIEVLGGVSEAACRQVVQAFFKTRR